MSAKPVRRRWIDVRQLGVLSDRYLDTLFSDPKALLLLMTQAPLIAALAVGVWSNVSTDTNALYFVLSLAAFFLGAANSAREIVKERDIYLRERMFNLDPGAYLLSKYHVLTMVMTVQVVLLTGIVRYFVPFKVSPFWVGAALFMVSLAGVSVGLVLSSLVSSSDRAVMAVPLVVIPQILFSDFVLLGQKLENWAGTAQQLMPVHWAYRFLSELRTAKPDWGVVVASPLVLSLGMFLAFWVAFALLSRTRY